MNTLFRTITKITFTFLMLVTAFSFVKTSANASIEFVDNDNSVAHKDAINWLKDTSITTGWNEGGKFFFKPYENLTRSQMAAFLYRYAAYKKLIDKEEKDNQYKNTTELPFIDVGDYKAKQDDLYYGILWMKETGISTGWQSENGYEFRPNDNLTRADMAAFIYRLAKIYNLVQEKDYESSFIDVTVEDWSSNGNVLDHYKGMLWMKENKVSTGWIDEVTKQASFVPLANIARADMAAFLYRLNNLKNTIAQDIETLPYVHDRERIIVSSLESISSEEEAKVLELVNNTSKVSSKAKQVLLEGDNIRVIFNDNSTLKINKVRYIFDHELFFVINGNAVTISNTQEENAITYEQWNAIENKKNITSVEIKENTKANRVDSLFSNLTSLTTIDVSNLNTDTLRNITSVFAGCKALTNISGLGSINTGNAVELYDMFLFCQALTSIQGLENWKTSNVEDFTMMFQNCIKLQDISPLTSWDTTKVKSFKKMFRYCEALTDISALSNWNTTSASDISELFFYDSKITSFKAIENWNVSNVLSFSKMFYSCINFKLENVKNWHINQYADISEMFMYCNGITSADFLGDWDVTNLKSIKGLFSMCRNLTDISGLEKWDISNHSDLSTLFSNTNIKSLEPLKNWNVSNVQNMSYIFNACFEIKDLSPIANWNTAKLENLEGAFSNLPIANVDALKSWKTDNLTNLYSTFEGCGVLADINGIADWKISKVTTLKSAFKKCGFLTNLQALQNWDVANCKVFINCFESCWQVENLKVLDNWKVASDADLTGIFNNIKTNLERPTWFKSN